MPLDFLVSADQNMLLVDSADPLRAPQRPDALIPYHTYEVFVFLQNSDSFEHSDVRVGVSRCGARDANGSVIRQLPPIDIPAQINGARTIAFVRFAFVPRPGTEGYVTAKILPEGPELRQYVATQATVPAAGLPQGLRSGKHGISKAQRISANAWTPSDSGHKHLGCEG